MDKNWLSAKPSLNSKKSPFKIVDYSLDESSNDEVPRDSQEQFTSQKVVQYEDEVDLKNISSNNWNKNSNTGSTRNNKSVTFIFPNG